MNDNERLDREMAFSHQHHTSYTCSEIFDAHTECKRSRGHDGAHAAGYGNGRKRWVS